MKNTLRYDNDFLCGPIISINGNGSSVFCSVSLVISELVIFSVEFFPKHCIEFILFTYVRSLGE